MISARPRLRGASAPALLVLAALASSGAALAAPPPAHGAADKAMAEALFRAGKELEESGDYAAACPKFAESHRLDPKPGTILNLAACHEQEGKTASAWADYTEAATLAARAHQPDRVAFAQERSHALEAKLSYVVLEFPAVPGVTVLVDGRRLTAAAAGTRVPLDPGSHAIAASAPGRIPWKSTIEVRPGPAERTITIPALAAEPTAPPPAAAEAHEAGGGAWSTVGWIGLGAGAVGVAVGATFGVWTLSKKSDVDAHCVGSFCDPQGLAANDDAHAMATVSTIGFVAGAALATAGLVILLVDGPSDDAPRGTLAAGHGSLRVAW